MARDSSGNYTLPAGNPVVSGTAISSVTHNTTMSDVGTEIQDSLSRSGKGGMTAPLRLPDGTSAAPALAFTGETGSGIYRAGANDVEMQIGGTSRSKWTAAGFFADVWTALTAIGATIKGAVADGASAVAAIIDNTITLSTTGAKLLSVRNNTSEKFHITKDGAPWAAATEAITLTAGANWNITATFANRTAGLVAVTVYATAQNGSANFSSIAVLPAGSRPPFSINTFCMVVDMSTTTYFAAQLNVNSTSGDIGLVRYDNGTSLVTPFAIEVGDLVVGSVVFAVV